MSYGETDTTDQMIGSYDDYGYGEDGHEDDVAGSTPSGTDGHASLHDSTSDKPRILIMGLRRSGKSSIQKVVFHKMSPNETLFLESTNKIVKDDINNSSFVCFSIWDLPGQMDYLGSEFDSEQIFGDRGAIVFVIDAQDGYGDALSKLDSIISRAYKVNPDVKVEIFIHKVDGLSDDHKIETQRDIQERVQEQLSDNGIDNLSVSFYLTSIYDHSIFEAFSKVVQKLIPQFATLENLLNIFISNSSIEKAFLFDVVSKIYIATDSTPVDMQTYELCCDMIDVVIDISCIYGRVTLPSPTSGASNGRIGSEEIDHNSFDGASSSTIKLSNETVLYLREVNKFLALVCILREDAFDKQGLIDYNFNCFREAIQEVFEVRMARERLMQQQHQQMLQQEVVSNEANGPRSSSMSQPLSLSPSPSPNSSTPLKAPPGASSSSIGGQNRTPRLHAPTMNGATASSSPANGFSGPDKY